MAIANNLLNLPPTSRDFLATPIVLQPQAGRNSLPPLFARHILLTPKIFQILGRFGPILAEEISRDERYP
jgi:hypothetical protein